MNYWFCIISLCCTINLANILTLFLFLKYYYNLLASSLGVPQGILCADNLFPETRLNILPLCGILSPSPVLGCNLTLLSLQFRGASTLNGKHIFYFHFYFPPLQSHALETHPFHTNCYSEGRGVLNTTSNKH